MLWGHSSTLKWSYLVAQEIDLHVDLRHALESTEQMGRMAELG